MFRQLNERLHTLAGIGGSPQPPAQFVCECSQVDCSLLVELTTAEYLAVREQATRFLVYPDDTHTDPEIETVMARHDGYWVVEKRGEAGEAAEYLADHGRNVL
jgi:hypothetical protein